jgi:RNA polymerase sigma factor (sigma-70 family)
LQTVNKKSHYLFNIFASPSNNFISSKHNHIDELDLVTGLKAKNPSTLDYLYDHYSSALYGIVFRIVRNEDVAEEVLQDVFLKIWDKIEAYDPAKGRLFTWMLNLARNQAIDKTRSKEISKERKTEGIDNLVGKIDRVDSEHQNVDAIGLTEVLTKLPDDQRFVIEKLYLEGYTQSEVAEEFNIPLGTVKTRTRMALIELRIILKVD